MSMLETDWRENLRGAGLPEPELDVEIRDERGILLGIADGAFPRFRVAVEVQGDHHRVTREQWNRDIRKHAAYRAAGWEPVELTSTHIRSRPGSDVTLVRAALGRQGWRP
jgi:very-short-patch-repair endonuclease